MNSVRELPEKITVNHIIKALQKGDTHHLDTDNLTVLLASTANKVSCNLITNLIMVLHKLYNNSNIV